MAKFNLSGGFWARQAQTKVVKMKKKNFTYWASSTPWGHVLSLKTFCRNPVLGWAIRYSVFQRVISTNRLQHWAGKFRVPDCSYFAWLTQNSPLKWVNIWINFRFLFFCRLWYTRKKDETIIFWGVATHSITKIKRFLVPFISVCRRKFSRR